MSMYIHGKYVISDIYGNMFTGYFDLNNPICRADMRNVKLYKTQSSAESELEVIRERYDIDENLKVYRVNSKLIDVEEPVTDTTFVVSEKIEEVYKIANNSIYFADKADYKRDLMEIMRVLNPNVEADDFKLEYLE